MLFTNVLQLSFVNLPLANAGVPLFTTNVYWQVILLIPIILIELFIHSMILRINLFRSLNIACITNILSTLVGIIIVFVFGFLFLFGVRDSFNPPLDKSIFNSFVVFRLIGLLVMWVISSWAEYRLGLRLMRGTAKETIKKSFLIANSLSYLFLATAITFSIIIGLSEARTSITNIQNNLKEFNRVCPVIVKSDYCDQVFHKRMESYYKLGRIYIQHDSAKKYIDVQMQASELRAATARTCSQNDQRVVCKEAR